jgi:hypothetical protein
LVKNELELGLGVEPSSEKKFHPHNPGFFVKWCSIKIILAILLNSKKSK